MHGHVDSVRLELAGDVVTSALSVGATQVPIGDAADFDESGGQVRIADVTYTYTMLDDGDDSGAPLLEIAPSLAVAVAAGDPVRVWNSHTSPPGYVKEWVASVTDDLDGNSIEATVSHALIGRLDEGVEALTGRSVVCAMDEDGDWVVTDVLGESAVITGALIRTSPDGNRVELWENPETGQGYVDVWTGDPAEVEPAGIYVENPNPSEGRVVFKAPRMGVSARHPWIELNSTTSPTAYGTCVLQEADLVLAGGASRPMKAVDFGAISDNADANGDVTVSHALGATPASILITGTGTTSRIYATHTITSSSFKVRTWNDAGTVMNPGVSVNFKWLALA